MYDNISVSFDRQSGVVYITKKGAVRRFPVDPESIAALGDKYWPLALARDLDDAIVHLSFNELELDMGFPFCRSY
ncbi:MAG: hypothetical protein CM1200mP30_00130 [Pseudomonadota bacterium]|nr:MAG: hypothetical protein CM1200mP30_00130 [Pseudomonadota bacterium]